MLARCGGVASRQRLLSVVSRAQLDHEVRSGQLAIPFPRAICRPWDVDAVRERAALVCVGPPAALSHLTALRSWGLLPGEDAGPVHVSVPFGRAPRSRPDLIVHRRHRLPRVMRVNGLPTVDPADAVVTSWPILDRRVRREPAITAVRTRLLTPASLRSALSDNIRLPGRIEMAASSRSWTKAARASSRSGVSSTSSTCLDCDTASGRCGCGHRPVPSGSTSATGRNGWRSNSTDVGSMLGPRSVSETCAETLR